MKSFLLSVVAALACAGLPAFADPPGSPEEVEQFLASPSTTFVLEDVTIIDGTGSAPLEHQSIVVAAGRIVALGSTRRIKAPPGAEVMRLTGRTVLPGLVMVHEHMMYFSGLRIWHSQAVSYPRLYLAAGVTTVRTAGGDFPFMDLNLKRGIDAGRMAGPRMHVTGPYFNGESDHFLGDNLVTSADEAKREVAYWASQGVTSFKAYTDLGSEALKGMITEARARGLTVTAHLGRVTCREAAELGIHNIEHSFEACLPELGVKLDAPAASAPDPAKAQSLIELLIRRGVVLTSTPIDAERPLSAEEQALLHPAELARQQSGAGGPPPGYAQVQRHVRGLERQFLLAGGRMVVGADAQDFGQIAGYANHHALGQLVAAGTPPLEVLRMATSGGAAFLGVADDVGSVEVGKRADLMVVKGDPWKDIADLQQVELVLKDGRAMSPAKLRASARGSVGWR